MVERTNEQQRMLEKRRADLAEIRRVEKETAQQLEAQEEIGEELGRTYTSLQQEVLENKTIYLIMRINYSKGMKLL